MLTRRTATGVSQRTVARVATTGTSVVLPPGALQSGQFCSLRVRASQGLNRTATPYKTALPYAVGVSGVLAAPWSAGAGWVGFDFAAVRRRRWCSRRRGDLVILRRPGPRSATPRGRRA